MIYDISCNLSGADTGIFKQKWTSTMAADALASCVARPSSVMLLTCNWSVSFAGNDFNYVHNLIAKKKYKIQLHVDGLVQERRNSSALAMELRLSCLDPSMYIFIFPDQIQ